jgi:hypothetical protein
MYSSTIPPAAAPEGFVMAMDPVQPDLPADYFDGPTETGDGWKIETTFTFERGVEFELMSLNEGYSLGVLSASQAVEAGTALAALGAKYTVPEQAF